MTVHKHPIIVAKLFVRMICNMSSANIISYFKKPVPLEQIKFVYQKRGHRFSQKEIAFINQNWNTQKKSHPEIYNGRLYDITNIQVGKEITLYYDIFDYKTMLAAEENSFQKMAPDYRPVHLTVTGILKTKDNKILIGSDLTLKNQVLSWKFPGGFFDADKDKTIWDCLTRECREEVGSFTFLNTKVINIVKNNTYHLISVICLTEIQETSKEVADFNTKHKDEIPDHHELQILSFMDFNRQKIADALDCSLISFSPTTRVGLESLLLLLKNT